MSPTVPSSTSRLGASDAGRAKTAAARERVQQQRAAVAAQNERKLAWSLRVVRAAVEQGLVRAEDLVPGDAS